MRARVDDAVGRITLGAEERAAGVVAEGELQDSHPRKPEVVAKLIDVGRDHAEILGDDRSRSERRRHGVEELPAGARQPAAMLRCGMIARNLPVAGEAAEVVDPEHVDQREGVGEAGNPPVEALLLVDVPAVERIAPALTRLAEVVGRDAGHHCRPAASVELEELGAAPHVGAVVGDEDRQVADDRDAEIVGPATKPRPLVVE